MSLGLVIQRPGAAITVFQPTTTPPSPGPNHIEVYDPAQGKFLWVECPAFPRYPGKDPEAVRNFFQQWANIEKVLAPYHRVDITKCPGYIAPPTDMVSLVVTPNDDIGNVKRMRLYRDFAPLMTRFVIRWPVDYLSQFMGQAALPGMWGNYSQAFTKWVFSTQMTPEEIHQASDNLRSTYRAWKTVPWPHKWLAGFMAPTRVSTRILPPPMFVETFRYYDAGLALTTYFPRTDARIHADIAQYLVDHADQLGEHFMAELNYFVKQQEAEIERKEERAEIIGYVLLLTGIVGGIAGAGVTLSIALSVGRTLTGLATAKSIGKTMLETLNRIFEALGVTQNQMKGFTEWIAVNARNIPEPEGPITPPGEVDSYSVFVEGEFHSSTNDPEDAVTEAVKTSAPGDRITLKDEESGKIVAMVIHGAEGKILSVPSDDIAKAEILPPEAVKEIAGVKKKIPTWLVIPAGVVAYMSFGG